MSDTENRNENVEAPAESSAKPATEPVEAREAPSAPPAPRSEAASPGGRRPPRPDLVVERAPVLREHGGYAFRLEPFDLARLRELPGSRGKTDEELGEEFLATHGDRLVSALAGDLPAPANVRVLVDPYSRQIFLALEERVRGIVSF